MKQKDSRSNGFTLLELLTVIAIIAVLAGLLFPTIKTALTRAEQAKAQQAVNGLATAFKAYYTEYGRWPIADTTPNQTYTIDANFVSLLQGSNMPSTVTATTIPASSSGTFQGNSRGSIFLEFKKADLNAPGNFVDPWGTVYKCRFDVNYQNWIDNPFFPPVSGNTVTNGYLIWSDGPDAQENTAGDGVGVNKDNITSWR